jgi:polyhydroxyalkanoate synthesis repressor PhaR
MANEKQPTIIKKYANRRLYHTGTSTYVTLEDLAHMVREGEDFVVYDAKTGEDITRSVLTQIIFEEESKQGQNTLLPVTFLRQLIRFYGDSLQALVPSYLEFSIENLAKDHEKVREQLSKTFGPTAAFQALQDQVQANMKMFQEALRLFTPFAVPDQGGGKPAADGKPAAGDKPAAGGKPKEGEGDINDLKRQVSEMQARLEKMTKGG